MSAQKLAARWALAVVSICGLLAPLSLRAQKEVMGELRFSGATEVDKDSGVWIDGQYVGFLKELKGDKKIVLLPGEHEIVVRQTGYKDLARKIVVEPKQTHLVRVRMEKDARALYPTVTAEVKLNVLPERAAVFVDDAYFGHASEFGGTFHSMLISPGKHRIKIALPGYRTFEMEVNLAAGQKSEIKTELVKGSVEQTSPLIKQVKQP